MRTSHLPLLSLLALLLAACSDDSQPAGDGPPAVDQGPASEGLAGSDARRDKATDRALSDTAPEAQVCGKLLDSGGAPMAGGDIIICIGSDVCSTATADSSGAFCVKADRAGEYLFHLTEKILGGKHYADVVFPLNISASEVSSRATIDLGTVTVPLITKVATLDLKAGGTLELEGGARLTVPPNSAVCPPLEDCTKVGLASVPAGKIHPRLLAERPGSPAPVLAYVLVRFDLVFSTAASFETPTPISASPVTLKAYRASHSTGKLEAQGDATVTAGKLQKALPALGWWLFYQP